MAVCSHPRATGVMLYRLVDGEALHLLLHATSHGEWGFPKGHTDPGESDRATAVRECAEECGIGLFALTGPTYELQYPVGDRLKTTVYFSARTAQERVQLSKEHDEARWCTAVEVGELLVHDNLTAAFAAHLAEITA